MSDDSPKAQAFDAIEQELDRLLSLNPLERAEALVALRRSRPDLAQEVARWLNDIEASAGFLEPESRHAGQRIGAWALVRLLGRGGMGEVWLAERADGVYEKRAAIKFLRLDRLDTARRLIQERELLARLEHPHIARLLDAGEDARAGAYLITDWIDGENLDQWLKSAPRPLALRLQIFAQVASAVAHAHRHLIIHRDIKPANIMIDANQRPFLLDFGIARIAADSQNASETRDLVATPNYAAPEQLQGGAVGTRADVYGLGALLYRLLTEQDALPLHGLALAELVHVVCERLPMPPSKTAPERGISRDLDAICLKALEKAPEQRYQSVDALLDDLAAYRQGAPVSARRGGVGYRLSKMLSRHRLAVGGAALLLLAIIGGTTATWWQAQVAAREAERANAVKAFLMELFASIDPEQSKGGQVLAEDLVQEGETRLQQETDLDPELRYELLTMLARMRLDLRQFDARLRNQTEACALAVSNYGPASDAATICTIELADSLRQNQQIDAANTTLEPVLRTLEQAKNPDPMRLAFAFEVQFMIERDRDHPEQAEHAIQKSIALARVAESGIGQQTVHSLEQYAVLLNTFGRLDEAEPLLLEILAFDQAHPDVRARSEQINTRWNLLTYYWSRERYQAVLDAMAGLTKETEEDLGRNHVAYFRQRQLLANVYARLGNFAQAIQIRHDVDAIDGIDRWANGNFRQMLWADQTLDLSAIGRTADSQRLAARTLTLTDERDLPQGPAFVACYGALYAAALEQSPAQREQWSECLQARFAKLNQAQQAAYRRFLLQADAVSLRQQGQTDAAISRLREAVALAAASGNGGHALERLEANLGFALIDAKHYAEAVPLLSRVRGKLAERLGITHPSIMQIDAVLYSVPEVDRPGLSSRDLQAQATRFQQRYGRPADRLRLW
ncbi:hypothetical protein C7S18_04720 [Ahniella affigens]|uniref:Protein kinase domain-containing protein n=1 Tax=Ahniella affigens TaxID=2021234 RepID=A0A2P1PNX0_9GAMM|nr:serine/threonine-protein kinase [Ahniella affigens]AVP96544.1 hypothetical protein C7S18_04720 [Ahniella affigens]